MVTFQDKAWCNETIMLQWINQLWKPACSEETLLVHRAQTTDSMKSKLEECKTEFVFVPSGTTSLVQPVDVVFNAPYKAAVERQATLHLQENLSTDAIQSGPALLLQTCPFLKSLIKQVWVTHNHFTRVMPKTSASGLALQLCVL